MLEHSHIGSNAPEEVKKEFVSNLTDHEKELRSQLDDHLEKAENEHYEKNIVNPQSDD